MIQRRTAWWATRHTFPCRSSSIITGSSLEQDDMEEDKEQEGIEEDKEQKDIVEPGYSLQEQEKSRPWS